MVKNILSLGFGMALLAAPFVSSAATVNVTASSVASPIAIATPLCPVFTRSLYVGVRGSDVTALQQYLAAQGYFTVSATGYFGPITESAVARWQAQGGVVSQGDIGSGTFGPLSRAYFARTCGGSTGSTGISGSGGTQSTSNITQINAPASVSLSQGDIAEIRNESAYFTLESLSSTSATINITPVGCWNSFPSDPAPKIICMIALVPTPPQTLTVGETYTSGNYAITLTQISGGTATFSVSAQ